MGEHGLERGPERLRPDQAEQPSEPAPRQARPSEPSLIVLLGRLAGVGWFVALSIAGGAIGGFWVDKWLDTRPIFTLVGLAIGLAVAARGMVTLLRTFGGRTANREEAAARVTDGRPDEK